MVCKMTLAVALPLISLHIFSPYRQYLQNRSYP